MKKYIAFFTALMTLASCSFLEQDPNVICRDNFYKTQDQAQYGLNGVYGAFNNMDTWGLTIPLTLLALDDLCVYTVYNISAAPLYGYTYDSGNSDLYKTWSSLYKGIRNANAFIEAIDGTNFDPDGTMVAQARFLRAYLHFTLAELFVDVPLRDCSTFAYNATKKAATPQAEMLQWCAQEIKDCIEIMPDSLDGAPWKVTRPAMQGILARVYMFLAGASVDCPAEVKHQAYKEAMDACKAVIDNPAVKLNPDYAKMFQNMIGNKYDHEYYESLWEIEFLGDRSSAKLYSNGRHGDINGLRANGATNYSEYNCNMSYGQLGNSLKCWDLYQTTDRTEAEADLKYVSDKRQEWNIPPYNYQGGRTTYPYGGNPTDVRYLQAGIDKSPYFGPGAGNNTNMNPLACPAARNTGKFRRECIYEGNVGGKINVTNVNYPMIRYADILLMYAEAVNEYYGAPTKEAYDCIVQVRDRAGIQTRDYGDYSTYAKFQQFVRNERGRELAFEGLRKPDLIRWGLFVKEMNDYKNVWRYDTRWCGSLGNSEPNLTSEIGGAVKAKHICYPIPDIELSVNDLLKQNPLW